MELLTSHLDASDQLRPQTEGRNRPDSLSGIAFNRHHLRNREVWELPTLPVIRSRRPASFGGVGTARSLAKLYSALVSPIDGVDPLLEPATMVAAGRSPPSGRATTGCARRCPESSSGTPRRGRAASARSEDPRLARARSIAEPSPPRWATGDSVCAGQGHGGAIATAFGVRKGRRLRNRLQRRRRGPGRERRLGCERQAVPCPRRAGARSARLRQR